MIIGLLFNLPIAYPPYTETRAISTTQNVTSVTPVVLDKCKIHEFSVLNIRKNVKVNKKYNNDFIKKTIVF